MSKKQSKNPNHGTHNKQQTKNKKTVYIKNNNRRQRQETAIILPKINLDKVIKSVAVFSPVLQQLAKIADTQQAKKL